MELKVLKYLDNLGLDTNQYDGGNRRNKEANFKSGIRLG